MKYTYTVLSILFFALMSCKSPIEAQTTNNKPEDFNQLSETFIQRLKLNQDTKDIQEILANTSIKELDKLWTTMQKSLPSGLTYTMAYIQVILKNNRNYTMTVVLFLKRNKLL